MQSEHDHDLAINKIRERFRRAFTFIRGFHALRTRVQSDVEKPPDQYIRLTQLPSHSCVYLTIQDNESASASEIESTTSEVLYVARSRAAKCPAPSERLHPYLLSGWDDARVATPTLELDDRKFPEDWNPCDENDLLSKFAAWREERQHWLHDEQERAKCNMLYERLYSWHHLIAFQPEVWEVVIGNGVLTYTPSQSDQSISTTDQLSETDNEEQSMVQNPELTSRPNPYAARKRSGQGRTMQRVLYPLLVQRVQLKFDPSVPEFSIHLDDSEMEFSSEVLAEIPGIDDRRIDECSAQLRDTVPHPLSKDAVPFLKRISSLIHARSDLVDAEGAIEDESIPMIRLRPYLLIRRRILGVTPAVRQLLSTIDSRTEFPTGLLRILGLAGGMKKRVRDPLKASGPSWGSRKYQDVLFGKPANDEQWKIADQLEETGAVLVQGPPGTGKSHTIANLIGHLLAQNKSVLVTSLTSQALSVVREKVVEQLRPLCVSVLDRISDDDADNDPYKEMKSAIDGIISRLNTSDLRSLERESQILDRRRRELLAKIAEHELMLETAIGAEYLQIVTGSGTSWDPSEAAQFIEATRDQHSWIPGPIANDRPLPLSPAELVELYSTNATTLPEDPAELRTTNPDPEERSNSENATPNQTTPSEMLLRPDVFAEYICDGNTPLSDQLLFDRKYWKLKKADRITEKHLHLVLRTGAAFTSMINGLQQWEMAALNAGHVGAAAVEPWDTLLQSIQEVENFALASGSVLQKNLVQFPPESSHGQLTIAKEICAHLAQGRRFPRIFVKPNWKTAIPKWTVNGDKPTTLAAFQAITAALELDIARQQLKVRWSQLIGTHGGPEITKFGAFPEETCGQYVPRIRDLLSSWHVNVLPLIGQIEALGFAWNRFLDEQPVEPGMFTKLNRFVSTLRGPFNEEVTRFAAYVHLGLAQQRIKDLHNHLSTYSGQYARALTDAVERRDPEAYRIAFENLSQYAQRKPWIERRMHLLGRLAGPNSQGSVASAWAMAIWRRAGMHGAATIPGDALAAWDWLQLLQEREQRLQLDPNQILQQITALREESESITNELIDRRAWAGQLLRVTPEHKQALVGWLDTIKRIGAGTGKRTETLTRVARQQMKICREAVPVWIMPLHRVVQSFDFSRQIFDVVIFDESSQCDVIGLLALTLAKTSVIVGDDRQVTPAGGGIELSSVSKLIESHLHEIPNKELWDGHLSMYNLASQSFGGVICLLEHFRCVPQIIQFRNHLCYDGKIRPLRDPGTSPVSPAVVESRVPDGKCDGQTNEREARWIAALVYAASELPEYAGQSFGVIALLGTATTKSRQNPQAAKVHEILISKLGEPRCKELRLKCTTASAFQGDERDVMFLSIVDSSSATEGPLRLSNSSETQKRYNVAASRARNQMWVVHSLDTKSDLKPADLRQRLIQHARDPEAITRQLDKKLKKADSPFEKEVIRALVNAGYIVTPQWQVGAYSIDIVVEGNGQRLAVECDGERYHTSENLADDLARQSLLERLGWIFHRIRGSEFYRDRTKTLQRLFNRLTEMRIEPSASNDTESPSMPQESSAARVMRRAHELKVLWDDEEKQERQLQTLARPPKPSRIASSKARESAITTRALPSAVPESTIQPLTDSTLAAPATVSPPHVENPLILPESNATTPEDAEVNHKIQRALFPKPENKPRSLFDN